MILYQGVARELAASPEEAVESYGQLQIASVSHEPHDRRWHTRRLPYDLQALRSVALLHNASSISSPLDAPRGEIVTPLAWTEACLVSTCRRVQQVQLVLEPVSYFVASSTALPRGTSEMSEAEFLSRLLTRTGCGWLVNLAQLYAKSIVGKFDPYEFLAEVLPTAPRVQLELADVQPIASHLWDLYRFASQQARGKLEAVFAPSQEGTSTQPLRLDAEFRRMTSAPARAAVR